MPCHGRDTALRTLALVALLVLGLGLPRLLVICIHADGIGRVEFVHAAGACCAQEQHHGGACCADDGSAELAAPGRGCEHVDFAIELAPPPAGQDHHDEPPPVFGWIQERATARTSGTTVPHPPATGPPRTDQRTLLRATTLLLL
ncbi:MAG TPA: hypothetical protein VFD82_01505 [Planctomycetota bacterium]|nr:hypothetical protein [Planctomycetota bacterium]